MKNFFWKFAICLVPCAFALWAVSSATYKYYQGEAGGFKFGVDLVGGTILVYEIDLRKTQDADTGFGKDPARDINILAESLKRRIDPNDLYNIVIRPAGGEGRIEIILPTGGTHRVKKAEDNWDELLRKLEERVSRSRPTSLKSAEARPSNSPIKSRRSKPNRCGARSCSTPSPRGTAC